MTTPNTASPAQQQAFIEEMKRVRGLDFPRLGMKVEMDGKRGTITGTMNGNLAVTFDDQKTHGKKPRNVHPTWRTKYFNDDGVVIAEYDDNSCVFRPEQVLA
jgi:hypothetical protein